MAKVAPDIVAKIALEIPATENSHVHAGLADAALAMPPELAAQMVPKAMTWIQSPFQLLQVAQKLGDLISHLAKSGQVDTATNLAKALLAARPDPRRNQKAVEENILLFPDAHPFVDL